MEGIGVEAYYYDVESCHKILVEVPLTDNILVTTCYNVFGQDFLQQRQTGLTKRHLGRLTVLRTQLKNLRGLEYYLLTPLPSACSCAALF